MAVFVDPKTGERYDNVPDDEADRAKSEFGLVSPEQYAAQQESLPMAAARAGSATVLAPYEMAKKGLRSVGLDALAPYDAAADPNASPGALEYQKQNEAYKTDFFAKAALAKEAHPIAALAGEALPMGIMGALGGTVGGGLAGGSELLGAGAGLLADSTVQGASQEAVDAISANGGKGREFSVKAALMNGGVNLAFGGLFLGAGHVLSGGGGRVLGEAASDIPASGVRPTEGVPGKRNWIAELDPGEVPEAVQGGRRARTAAGAPVDLAGKSLEDLNALPIDAADRVRVDALKEDPAFARTGRVSSNDGQRGITLVDDDGDLVLRDGRHRLTAAQELGRDTVHGRYVDGKTGKTLYEGDIPLKRQARSVGARGNTPETMPAHEVEHFIRNEETIVDDMRTVAGGGPGEKGAFQDFNESFRKVTANRVKRQDFDAAEALLDPVTRRELALTTDTIADELATVASTLESRGAKRQAGILRAHITELGESANKTGVLDRAKQTLDDLHMRAIVDKTDPYGEVLDAVNPAAERIRSTLEDPRFVGDKIAELQQVRNSAWSDKDTGFIRNMQIANETGVKLFKKIDRDYHTGDLVMQFDPGAFKQLLALDAHESKPVLEAWAKVLDSAERMAANTVEAGAQSAATAPLGKLHDSIGAIREIFTTQDKRIVARDLARPGQELLSRAEQVPFVGPAIRGAKAVIGKDRVESFVAGAASRHVPVPERSVARARAALQRHAPATVTPEAPGGPPSVPPPRGPGGVSGSGTGGSPQVPPGSPANDVRGKVAGVAALAGGGALLASGTAGAAEMGGAPGGAQLLPEQQQARADLTAQLSTLPPDQQQATLRTAEAFARIQQKTTQRVEGAVKDLFALAKDPQAKPRYRSPQARELDKRSVQLDVPRHLARFMGKNDDPIDAWRDKSELLDSVMADPSQLARTMAENLGDLPTQQPEMFASMVGQTMATVQYLHERKPGVAGQSALDPDGYPPTFEEISEWAGHWVGAIHPLDSLDDLASNELVPEQIEAVQNLWPEGYAMFQSSAMAQIHELSQQRGVIALEALEQIDSALDLDGAGEPILSSAFASLLKQATAKDAEKMKAEAPKSLPPMQSQSPSRLASSSLASFHAE